MKGGLNGVTDTGGHPLVTDYTWTFTTAAVALPDISLVDPMSGSAGTLITITGSNFGEPQGSSTVWLGTRAGVVESWTDGVITARIAAGASSGTVQVRRSVGSSDTIPITVLTPMISNATPDSGGIGTSVTIDGNHFGNEQGTGQVWLGTAAGVVTNWGNTQIRATIAPGSQTGFVQVLQNGVASNSEALTITGAAPHLDALSPTQGASGTVVALYGSGFGDPQGSGTVQLGSGLASVVSWSDTLVRVSVPTNAVSGVVKLQQAGLWSNAVAFRVPAALGAAAAISPVSVSMVVGETRSLQALDDDGELVTGATWTSSNTNVVSLSTADPPVLTAVAPGTVTIKVGGASAEVTVYSGPSLPLGAVVWSNGASTSRGLYPAVPNYDAVADVFAVGLNPTVVTAITADGSTAWTQQGLSVRDFYPDFQGGAVVVDNDNSLWRLDPLTGAPLQLFSYASIEGQSYGQGQPRLHPDGTVFVVDHTCKTDNDQCEGSDAETGAWVVGLDAKTSVTKFRVKLRNSIDAFEVTETDGFCGGPTRWESTPHAWVDHAWSAIVAGDGYYYVPYRRYEADGVWHRAAAQVYPNAAYDIWDQLFDQVSNSQFAAALSTHAALTAATGESYNAWDSALDTALKKGSAGQTDAMNLVYQHQPKFRRLCDSSTTGADELRMIRVGPDGTSTDVLIKRWNNSQTSTFNLATGTYAPWGYRESRSYTGTSRGYAASPSLITDSDTGMLISWVAIEECPSAPVEVLVVSNPCVPTRDEHLSLLRNGALASDVVWGHDWQNPVRLDLQLEDGSFVGGFSGGTKVFDAQGHVKFGEATSATYALEGGGFSSVGDNETYEFDANGSLVGIVADGSERLSWHANGYSESRGIVERRSNLRPQWAPSYTAMSGGNPGTLGTALRFVMSVAQTPVPKLPDYGGGCRPNSDLGLPFPPLQGNAYAYTIFSSRLQRLRESGTLTSASCSQHLSLTELQNPLRFDQWLTQINALTPLDGSKTLRSQVGAGLVSPTKASRLTDAELIDRYSDPVCAVFLDGKVTAASQQVRLAGDPETVNKVFITTRELPLALGGRIIDYLRPATILHEALHGLTLLSDGGLAGWFTFHDPSILLYAKFVADVEKTSGILTTKLEDYECAPKQ